MTRILIIEDEIPARKKLLRFIGELSSPTKVIAEIDTVAEAIAFLEKNQIDLIFSDIELLDGNAFEIYTQVTVSCPIIFTTAYDQFWMDAFDSNGIAYLLKPFTLERFQKAWDKFQMLKSPEEDSLIKNIKKLVLETTQYKKRFTISNSQGIYFLNTDEILFFEATEGVIFAYCKSGKKHLLTESTLKEIEEKINPNDFYRINRSQVVNKIYVERIERYTKNTLLIKIGSHNLITSQSTTSAFKNWIEN